MRNEPNPLRAQPRARIRTNRFVPLLLVPTVCAFSACGEPKPAPDASAFRVLAFYTADHDPAHIDFVREAHSWLADAADSDGFLFEATSDWSDLNDSVLAATDVVVFLDSRPEAPAQRQAFRTYMENGGAWLGFHFAAFALTPSAYPQNWDWYHRTFLGSGSYRSNTWRPTSAILRVENPDHPVTEGLPPTFVSAPNEWYRWELDLRAHPDLEMLVVIDSTSFPLGTGPKPDEIWHEGTYPVVWTNRRYRMVYLNMGHNDMDYEGGTNEPLSSSFSSETQNRLVLNALRWLGGR